MILAGVKEAREEATRAASELLRGDGDEFWNGPDWTMRVTDEAGIPVFTTRILMDDHDGDDCLLVPRRARSALRPPVQLSVSGILSRRARLSRGKRGTSRD
jgi:hypothetical protein